MKDSSPALRIPSMRIFRQLVTLVFGSVSWQPPRWCISLGGWGRRHRRMVAAALILTAVVGIGGWRAYEWYKKRPKPVTVAIFAESIPVTPLEKQWIHIPPLVVRFNDSAAPLDKIGKLVRTGIHIDPSVEGVWRWNGDRRLVFTPAKDWPAAQKYRIKFDKEVIAPHVLLNHYEVQTSTSPFTGSVTKMEFYQNPIDPAVKQVVATLEFSHKFAPGELEKHLSLTLLGGSQVFKNGAARFEVKPGLRDRIAYVTSGSITLPEREDFIKLVLDGKMPTTQGGALINNEVADKTRVPDIHSFFKIKSSKAEIVNNSDGDPEQMIFVNTTAAARPEEIAKSLEIFLLPPKPVEKTDAAADPDPDPEPPARRHGRNVEETEPDADSDEDNTEEEITPPPQWKSPREVDEEVLKTAKPVKFSVVPSDKENTTTHIFKIKVETEGSLYMRIRKGVLALGDFTLGDDYDTVLGVPAPSRDITIQGQGGVLALSGERKLLVRSRAVPVIEYQIARVPADQINHLVSQTEGSFQNPEFVNRHFDETNIARIATERQVVNAQSFFKPDYSTFDFSSHLVPAQDGGSAMQGLFFLKARGWNPKTKKYLAGDAQDQRFILVTDIGILVKQNADGSRDVFLQSLKTREPLGNVTVDILARNGVPSVSGTTTPDGRVTFPSLGKPAREKEPVAIVARNGNDVAFIPFARDDRKLDFSRFDIDGIQSKSGAELDAFVFTERGVYRPGDEMHIAFTVKQRNWAGNLAGLPLETEVVDARGMSVQVKKLALTPSGFMEFSYQTVYESPTGEYTINVYLLHNGKRHTLLGSADALVKEFLPDRMKIDSRLSTPATIGWIDPKAVQVTVTLQNLYGTPATGRRIVSRMRLNPARFEFPEYKDYSFYDRLLDKKAEVHSEQVELGEKTTDDAGTAQVDLDLERFSTATYAMDFYAEGFEAEGGRSVNAQSSALVSSLPYVVGYKADGDLGYVKMNSSRTVDLIAIDRMLTKIAVPGLEFDVILQTYVSVLTKQEDGTYSYESVRKETTVRTGAADIAAGGLKFTLPSETPGNYFLELREKESGNRVSRFPFSVVGLGGVSRSLDKNAELNVKLNRRQYNAGDDIEVNITAPYLGSGLITIERDKVYAHTWFKADQTGSVQHIRLPAGFDGTGYVNVSFIRSLDSKEIFMSPLSYAVVPFTANLEKRRLKIDLNPVREAKPGEPLKIGFRTDRPSKIVIYAVDQGILQVTDYQLPDPLEYYFRKTALMVQTSQIVDLLIPEFSILRAAAFGGDGEARHLNPFKRVTEKPVVFWSGVIDADSTEHQVVYDVPDYFNGTLQIMAVAVSPDSVGGAKQETLIRGPFVLTPGVPTLAAPGDQFEVGVTVANNVTGSGSNAEVNLTAEASEHLEIMHSPLQPLRVPEGREISTVFTVRAKSKLGSASLTFKASALGQESKLRSTLSVRPAVPLMTKVLSGNFTKSSVTVPVDRVMLPDYRNLEAVLSAAPLGLARGLDVYLKNYPNGCSEQITSGAFCRLMIAGETDFGLTRTEIFAQLEKTFDVLRRRQNDQGTFGYWAPEKNDGIDFISTYVMHFLIEAKAAGFVPPADVFQSGLRNLQHMVIKEPGNIDEARTLAYAIYLLTREEVITTNYILNLRDYLDKHNEGEWQNDLTGVYLAGAWSMLKKDDEAQKIITAYKIGSHDRRGWWDFYQPLGSDSQYIAVIARHFPGMLRHVSAEDFKAITGPVGRGEFNTLSAAYAVLALKSYTQYLAQNPPRLGMVELNKEKHETALEAAGKLMKRAAFSANAASLRFTVEPQIKGMGVFYQMIETGFDRDLPSKAVAEGVEVYREFVDKNGDVTNAAHLGEPLTVHLKIRSLEHDNVTNVALVDLLPGGFEIVSSSLQPGAGSAGCDYVDVREDRAVFYTTVGRHVRCITYQIKPGNRGEFVVPPVFAESMYDRAIHSCGLPGRITVTNAK